MSGVGARGYTLYSTQNNNFREYRNGLYDISVYFRATNRVHTMNERNLGRLKRKGGPKKECVWGVFAIY